MKLITVFTIWHLKRGWGGADHLLLTFADQIILNMFRGKKFRQLNLILLVKL